MLSCFSILIFFFAALSILSPAEANNPIHNNDFSNHFKIATLAAPDWHFQWAEQCYPTAALYDNGAQHLPGRSQCPPDSSGGQQSQAHPFPTYYLVRHCSYDGGYEEYHVMYNLYFPYSPNDVGPHDHDWEWAMVKWQRWSQDHNYWIRKSIVLEAHGNLREYKWADYPRTNSPSDEWNWRKNAENPVITSESDGHPLTTNGDRLGKWWRASDWLVNAQGFPKFDWKKASSSPDTFVAGGTHDLCWVK